MDIDVLKDYMRGDSFNEVQAAPLVQIFSFWVDAKFGDKRPSEVYGSIRATEGPITSVLYCREADKCETIVGLSKLSLIDSQDDVILGLEGVSLDVCLKDKIRGTELVNKKLYLDFTTQSIDDTYDKLMKVTLEAEGNFAYLYYIAYRYGALATIKVTVAKKGDDNDGRGNFTNVHGSVVASFDISRLYVKNEDEVKYLETVLFERSLDEPVWTTVGTPIGLSRSAVAVPAYSILAIKVDLFDSELELASGSLEFPAHFCRSHTKLIESKNGCVQVEVSWRNPYHYMYKERKFVMPDKSLAKGPLTKSQSENGCAQVKVSWIDPSQFVIEQLGSANKRGAKGPVKKFQVLDPVPCEHRLSSLSNVTRVIPQSHVTRRVARLTEIFSVCVGGLSGNVSSLSGTIKLHHTIPATCIYNGDQDDLPDDKIVCIEQHFPLKNFEFHLSLYLKDPIAKLEVSKGEVVWNVFRRSPSEGELWINKPICSVVRGIHGYAAVHYAMFCPGFIATIEVTISCDTSTQQLNLCGVIFASYGGHAYSRDLEMRYYRSRLFSKPTNKPAVIGSDSKVPLSKSVVVMPVDSSLIIDADLKAIGRDNYEAAVYGNSEFVVDLFSTVCKEIQVGSYCISVSVKFST